jgi:THO complex subunit 2
MQEQERLAGEEAEKRLKAALTAKREPGTTASRVASPAGGNVSTPESSDPKPPATEESETPMEVDLTPSQKDDVRLLSSIVPSFLSLVC